MEQQAEINSEIISILNFLIKSDIEMYGYITSETLEDFKVYGVEPPTKTEISFAAGELHILSPQTDEFQN